MKFKNTLFYRYIGSAVAHPKNFFFCLKYPFMKSRNVWSSKFMGYAFTMLDDFEPGWQKAFGQQLLDDLKAAIKKDKKPIYWEDIKEKWGSLCLYCSSGPAVEKVVDKYELLSHGYCIYCGKPARYCTRGYVSYVCEECLVKEYEHCHDIAQLKKDWRLSGKDIPKIIKYKGSHPYAINIKKRYGIDFKELWGLTHDKK